MNKKRWFAISGAALLIGSLWTLLYYMQPAVAGLAKSDEAAYVFSDKEWTLHFTRALNKETITEDSVYVLSKENERIPVQMTLNKEGTLLSIASPEKGYANLQEYTLHLSDAIKSKLGLGIRGTRAISFQVVDDLPTVESEEYLKKYFAALLEKEKNQQRDFSTTDNAETLDDSAFSASDTSGAAAEESGGGDFSETNNQVEGVSESDIVQTDGNYIYHINSDENISIVEAKQYPDSPAAAGTISFEGNFYPTQLFLKDQKLIVLGEEWNAYPEQTTRGSDFVIDQGATIAKIYDITSPDKPELIREVGAEGYFSNARMIDEHLYFITTLQPQIWLMEKQPDMELRPRTWDSQNEDEFTPVDVKDIKIIPENEQSQYSIITAVNVNDLESPAATETYLGSSGQVYMSENNLYLANSSGPFTIMPIDIMPAGGGNSETSIYKFAIDGLNVKFMAKGTVKGGILNQFSMDEHNGNFRVATTEGNTFGENRDSLNHLFILNENMEQIGSVEGLAKGERIYSARFLGDKAYMVTFRETDPLFVIDTKNPEAPEVLGELKIPGFSTYLHPLDENHLIGFGVDTELFNSETAGDPPMVRQTGMKISLFDITDFSNPKEKDIEIIGGAGTYSTLMHDHKSLFRHKERSLFGFPVSVYEQKDIKSEINFVNQGAMLYTITAENGIQLVKEIWNEKQEGEIYEDWETQVQRLLYIDNTLYTVRRNGIEAHELN
ncbi:beta-propeller domain-containing protein [Jeotgalibacillus proteolyticus]|uniref:SbsA Ig-like domain-containing protein n=1 Tax=Jeotgalibacillus proteolyticus TaxID=2082395 RepID=A0A2S5GA97_9BACL|nr:beta-propeller domain-containing protein [Jeotgalibacillus proteolyticus]PPA69845.1 hypothetical protein C4B60_15045 [Jeotgalibacillus proteolyticus]